jgi:signal transduction histidine kinase
MTIAHNGLVADDNETNRAILSGSLKKAGFGTLEAANGEEAVRIAREELPSLVLLDLEMPGLDGFEVCERLKATEETAEIPVIFLTAYSGPQNIEKAFAVGGSDYVTKPFHMGEIKARLSVHLQLRQAKKALEETHAQLLHAQKMESIGQLAAGIAHEINTPTQFVGDNARFLRECFEELLPRLTQATSLAEAVCNGEAPAELAEQLRSGFKDADISYLSEEIPRALEQSIEGIERVAAIVKAMKEFSHPGVKQLARIDLNRAIHSTATVASNEWKYVADMKFDLDSELPHVLCLPGELNQVVLNMIVNAAHAIADIVGDGGEGKGLITVTTHQDGAHTEIRITDSGSGIPPEAQARIFEPFFTTKEVGRGTGQGLSMAHNVIVKMHGGTITFETESGHGTTFIIRLPTTQQGQEAA